MKYFRYIAIALMFVCICTVYAQEEKDTVKMLTLKEVVVASSYRNMIERTSSLSADLADKQFLGSHFTGNLAQTLGHIAGVRSMNIGTGFAKPMIRGLGFNRIVVTENGIKQEGQQWGADHGLEMDAFNVERVVVRKGPLSLLYGSDAMGGAIEILPPLGPSHNQVFGEAVLLGKSVNATFGGSLMLGVKHNEWHIRGRISESHFGDYRIPADTVVYLTQRMPVAGRRLKNTAGFERDAALFAERRKGAYYANYAVSNAYQKTGFFVGAHGTPDVSRLQDDHNSRNIEMPYSVVSHFKLTTRQRMMTDHADFSWDGGFQRNRREEWSLFHTHYGAQPLPAIDPDKELAFSLSTVSSLLKIERSPTDRFKWTAGWDLQWQRNDIGGYSFLLPEYNRFTTGALLLGEFRPHPQLTFNGGLRYDFGKINIVEYQDLYIERYLRERNYIESVVEANKWRSNAVNAHFGDVSGSLGVVWKMSDNYMFKANMGRSFRLPGANELATNGVHHGAFRHERGDASLGSETGWQTDVSLLFNRNGISLTISPFLYYFEHYIYLRPTGEWSVLPHAGQIYRYTGVEALFAGSEAKFGINIVRSLTYAFSAEYVYAHNADEHTPMAFSPPFSMRNTLRFNPSDRISLHLELQTIADQYRVAKNEDRTSGANLVHLAVMWHLPFAEVTFSSHNLLNVRYLNHLSFYRKAEIPEPGRNLQLSIILPFKILSK
jgi:iron complex outermembrane receptor protein